MDILSILTPDDEAKLSHENKKTVSPFCHKKSF